MMNDRPSDHKGSDPTPPAEAEGEWSEEGRRWYQELKGEEDSLAPWLNWEWTGDQMKARRG